MLGLTWLASTASSTQEAEPVLALAAAQGHQPAELLLAPEAQPTKRREAILPQEGVLESKAAIIPDVPPMMQLTPIELFDRAVHHSYGKATFSFEHGLRDDSGNDVTGNDWEVQYSGGRVRVNMVTDDKSLLFDLGPVGLDGVAARSLVGRKGGDRLLLRMGHSYVVWTRDSETDLTSIFEVLELRPKDSCLLDWYTINGHGQASGSFTGHNPGLVEVLAGVRELARDQPTLTTANVLLQLRSGAIGGNPLRLNMAGEANGYIREVSEVPLALGQVGDNHEPAVAYSRAGFIPRGQTFLVNRIAYRGFALGDSNGPGAFKIQVGEESIVDKRGNVGIVHGVWTGEILVEAGEEDAVFLEISNSSVAHVELEGSFLPTTKHEVSRKLLPGGMVQLPMAELNDNSAYSFAAGHEIARKRSRGIEPDIAYMDGMLRVGQQEFFDLGPVSLAELKMGSLPTPAKQGRMVPVKGHCYFFSTKSGRLCLFHVEEVRSGGACVLDWYSQDRIVLASGSHARAEAEGLAETPESFASDLRKRRESDSPHVQVQPGVGSLGSDR